MPSPIYVNRLRPIVEAHGEPADNPKRHGEPIATCFRR